jgi:hypothetical protein
MTVLVVGVAAPTPGGVGGFHAAYQFAVTQFFAAPTDRAIGAAIVLHAVSFIPVTLLGLLFMTREGLTFGSARRIASEGGTGAPGVDEARPTMGAAAEPNARLGRGAEKGAR